MSGLDLQSVRIVRAIAESGSITGAARLLGYSQPAISQHLQRAETRLGLALVTRVGRTVRLTEAGTVLARHAVAITTALDAAEGELADLAGLAAGAVRIAGFPTASSTVVPRMLAAMAERHPGIAVSYVEAEPPEAEAMVRDGSVDLAVTFRYESDRDAVVGLATTPLFSEETVVVLPAQHPLAAHSRVDLTRLAEERWIAGCPRCRGHLLDVCDAVGFAPGIGFETDNAAAVLSMVASGLGVAMLPRLALATSALPHGAVIRPHSPAGVRTVQLVTTAGARRVPSVAAAVTALTGIEVGDWALRR